jgi:hypothetical protein
VTARAVTSLNQIEDKLRRSLDLVGDVGLQFTPSMDTVVVGADLTAIGNATYRGRRFAMSQTLAGAPPSSWAMKATDEIVITSISMRNQTAAANILMQVNLALASTTDPYAINTAFAPWVERATSLSDFAPVLRSAVVGAAFGVGNTIYSAGTAGQNQELLITQPIFLNIGDKLGFTSSNWNGTWTFNLTGYVY